MELTPLEIESSSQPPSQSQSQNQNQNKNQNQNQNQTRASSPPTIQQESGGKNDNNNGMGMRLGRNPSDDAVSAISFRTQKTASSTDGIDVLGEPPESNDLLPWKVPWIGHLVSNIYFKRAIIGLILVDSAFLGLATFDFVTTNERLVAIVSGINSAFLCIFTVELILRLFHIRINTSSNEWLIFDVIVISCSWIFSMLLVVRAFRVIRTLRLATRLKGIRTIALALHEVMPKFAAVAFLGVLSFYIFSIMFTDLYQDLYQDGYTDRDYFSSIDVTAFTLFQIMTLDQWATITKDVQQAHPFSWLLFIPFILASSFFVLNLTIAVLYEAMIRVRQREDDPMIVPPDRGVIGSFETSANKTPAADALARLERKVDSLTIGVERLLQQQMQLQASVSGMSPSSTIF